MPHVRLLRVFHAIKLQLHLVQPSVRRELRPLRQIIHPCTLQNSRMTLWNSRSLSSEVHMCSNLPSACRILLSTKSCFLPNAVTERGACNILQRRQRLSFKLFAIFISYSAPANSCCEMSWASACHMAVTRVCRRLHRRRPKCTGPPHFPLGNARTLFKNSRPAAKRLKTHSDGANANLCPVLQPSVADRACTI